MRPIRSPQPAEPLFGAPEPVYGQYGLELPVPEPLPAEPDNAAEAEPGSAESEADPEPMAISPAAGAVAAFSAAAGTGCNCRGVAFANPAAPSVSAAEQVTVAVTSRYRCAESFIEIPEYPCGDSDYDVRPRTPGATCADRTPGDRA